MPSSRILRNRIVLGKLKNVATGKAVSIVRPAGLSGQTLRSIRTQARASGRQMRQLIIGH